MIRSWVTTPSHFRAIVRIKQPAVEPVSLLQMKHHLGIEPEMADDDEYLLGLLAAARILVEERLGMTTVATQWRAKLHDVYGCGCVGIEVPYPPMLYDRFDRPVEITWKTNDGTLETMDPVDIEVDDEEFPGRIRLRKGIHGSCCQSLATIKWWAGYEEADSVPRPIRTAIQRIVAGMYGNRGDTAEAVYEKDAGVASMLAACSYNGRH